MAKIFIAEDDDSIRHLYRKVLILKGHEIIGVAADGDEAISNFKGLSERPDIVIMDYRMPGKNGLEAMKEIMAFDKTPIFIFASADNKAQESAIALGARTFKAKPFSIEKLCNNIEKVLEENRSIENF